MKQNQNFYGTYSNMTSYLFFIKNYSSISMTFKIKFLSFMTKVNPNNGNEIKPDIFSWDIFKSDISFHWSKNTKIFQ